MAFTHIGRPGDIERLPWHAGALRNFNGSVEPGGPAGITVAVTETGNGMQFSTTFHANVVDRASVVAAMDVIADDPLSLLEQAGAPLRGLRSMSQQRT